MKVVGGVANHFDLFVTGGSGFVGQALMSRLQSSENLRIAVGTRGAIELSATKQNIVSVDYDLVKMAMPQFSAGTIVHIAAEKSDPARMCEVNVEGTRRLTQWAASVGTSRFIYLSSVGVYGAGSAAGNIDSSHAKSPGNAYECSKLAAEEIVKEICDKHRIAWTVLQPSNVVGINSRSRYPLLGLMRALKAGRFVFVGRNPGYVNYVAVENIANCILELMVTQYDPASWILNTSAPLEEFVTEIALRLNVRPPQIHVPSLLAAGGACLFAALESITGRAMPFNMIKYRELTNTTIYDDAPLVKLLGTGKVVGWRAMIANMVSVYQSRGLL